MKLLVSILRAGISPSTVCRRVIAVIVDAVKAVSGWARSHVAQERLEAVDPLRTDCDATPAPAFKADGLWIETSTLHRAPRVVLGAPDATPTISRESRVTVRNMRGFVPRDLDDTFTPPTTATLSNAGFQQRWSHMGYAATVADTTPSFRVSETKHGESVKALADREWERWRQQLIIARGLIHQTDELGHSAPEHGGEVSGLHSSTEVSTWLRQT